MIQNVPLEVQRSISLETFKYTDILSFFYDTNLKEKLLPPLPEVVKAMVCSSVSDITAETNLNGFEAICCLILKLSHLDITSINPVKRQKQQGESVELLKNYVTKNQHFFHNPPPPITTCNTGQHANFLLPNVSYLLPSTLDPPIIKVEG